MRVLLINRFAGGQRTPTGRMLADVARQFLSRSIEVEIWCSGASYADEHAGLPQGVCLRRLGASKGPRLWQWLLFWLEVMLRLPWTRPGPCILLTDPPYLSLAALPAHWLGRGPFYLWTMDLYPEALVAAGWLREGGLLHGALCRLMALSMRAMHGCVVLDEVQGRRMAMHGTGGVASWHVEMLPPWDERPMPRVEKTDNPWLAREGLGDRRVALYAGNLGEGHEAADLVEAARCLQDLGRRDWALVMVCRGSGLAAVREAAADLPALLLRDYVPESEAAALLWAADVHLITMKPGWEGVIVPSKLYGALQTASPVLFIGPAESGTAQEILRQGRGKVLKPGCGGAAVIGALDELGRQAGVQEVLRGGGGPQRLVEFVLETSLGWVRRG